MTGSGTPSGEELRVLIRLSAALGAGDRGGVEAALEEAAGLVPNERVEEALLQAYLFVGFPPVLEAFSAWREETGPPEEGPEGPPPLDARSPDEIVEAGRAACRRIYGGAYRGLRRNVSRLHPDLDRWMVSEGYGKVLSRRGLDLATRELCIVALLTSACWPRQLHSHLRGALRVGAEPDQVEQALETGIAASVRAERRVLPEGWEGRCRELWERVRRRHREAGETAEN